MARIDLSDDQVIGIDEQAKSEISSKEDFSNIEGLIKSRFLKAEDARIFDESRWLKAYRNYRGIYGNDMAFTESEKSKVFVKITKTKVMAAYGQIIEVLFSSGKFPLGITPTAIPEGTEEYAHVSKSEQPQQSQEEQLPESPYGFPGDVNKLQPGATIDSILGVLRGIRRC